jgi:hypothetical protein
MMTKIKEIVLFWTPRMSSDEHDILMYGLLLHEAGKLMVLKSRSQTSFPTHLLEKAEFTEFFSKVLKLS